MNKNNSKKTAIIAIAILAAIGALIAVISVLGKGGKNTDPKVTPTVTPSGAEPTATPEPGIDPDAPTPTPKKDYTGDKIEFTNDMPDLVFSHSGNFYKTDIPLRLYSRYEGTIYYTTDGSHPTKDSNVYDPAKGITLTANAGTIPKVWSVRAAAVYADGKTSGEFVHTYILGAHVDTRYQTMVFVINGDPAELTEEPDGILFGENYENRGRESERAIYLEAFDTEGNVITSQHCGVRVYGAYSRRNSQKSMKFYARKSYSPETGTFYLNCLNNITADGTQTQVVRFDKFVLRASGNDYRFAFMRDELNQMLAAEAGFTEYESVCPAICYINGEYYGFFWVHASYCDTYLKNKYGDSPAKAAAKAAGQEEYTEGEFVILEGGDAYKKTDESDELVTEWAKSYDTDYYRFAYGDLTDAKLYNELRSWMDVEDYLSYMAYNIYFCNKDWPNNNYKCFRYVPADGEKLGTGVYDGRWRYLLHDMDYCLGLYDQTEVLATYDTLRQVLSESSERYAPLLDALLKRDDCVEYFVKASLDFANGALSAESYRRYVDSISASRSSEMTYYYNYIASLGAEDAVWVNESQLQGQLQKIIDFAEARPARSLSYLKSRFLLGSSFSLEIAACRNAQLTVNSYTAPADKGFSGTYVTDYATTVSATCRDGYTFDYWEVNGKKVTQSTLKLTEKDIQNGKITITLYIKEDTAATVVIDTIGARGDDFILLHNPTSKDINVGGYTLTDGAEREEGKIKFTIPQGTTIAAGESLRINCVKATAEEPVTDPMTCPFKLSKGDTLTLANASGKTITSVAIPNLHSGFVYRRNAFTGEFREEAE
ncbi:MAG: CotH kinase family protein [Lachnospiraceae bacterium]|nr:CotH kinase family protein [Lachnospiraceae bacterium]